MSPSSRVFPVPVDRNGTGGSLIVFPVYKENLCEVHHRPFRLRLDNRHFRFRDRRFPTNIHIYIYIYKLSPSKRRYPQDSDIRVGPECRVVRCNHLVLYTMSSTDCCLNFSNFTLTLCVRSDGSTIRCLFGDTYSSSTPLNSLVPVPPPVFSCSD